MEATSLFFGRTLIGPRSLTCNVHFYPLPSRRFFPASCKWRRRNFSLQNKRQQPKKLNLERPKSTNAEPNDDPNLVSSDGTLNSNQESVGNDSIPVTLEAGISEEADDTDSSNQESAGNDSISVTLETVISEEADDTDSSNQESVGNDSIHVTLETGISEEDDDTDSSNQESVGNDSVPLTLETGIFEEDDDTDSIPVQEVSSLHNGVVSSAEEPGYSHEEKAISTLPSLAAITSLSATADGEDQLTSIHLQDLVGMIRNAERNIHLINQARIRTLEDLEEVFSEKESLQGEINMLEMKLAETDARLKVAAQEKIRVELLENQLETLRDELSNRGSNKEELQDMYNSIPSPNIDAVNFLRQELDSIRAENTSLKDELLVLKAELGNNIIETDQRVQVLTEERSILESSLKELESKLATAYEDVSKVPTLYEKVEDLQTMLDKATKQADQAILVLEQNQELRKKVESLEQSLSEANEYKLSSQKLQKYNELMQQKIELLDERLQKSDEEIQTYVQLYQNSVQEFQDTLNSIKEESKERKEHKIVQDRPWEFWSNLLLTVDGWLLEKKISAEEAKPLRDLIWNKEGSICDAYLSCKGKSEREIIATFIGLTLSTKGERFHVIHIAAEMAPVAKVGGLGDVVAGLSKAFQKKGHLVEIVLPKYDCMQYERIQDLKALDVPVESYFDGQLFKNKIWVGTVEGLPVYFIEPLHPSKFFWRGEIYGENDDFKRFSYFSRAALELILQAGKKPDIIHCHDWQTAFVAPLYWDVYVAKGLNSARICFTCHNFEYQGTAPASDLASCGLDVHHLNRPDRMQDHWSNDRVNPVKGAVVFSNIVTTVSQSYAQEVRTNEGGHGLSATLNSHAKKFVGILNGIDTDSWNPATDPFLKAQYSSNEIEGKAENKVALQRHLGLSFNNVQQPLVSCITRLVPQKGVHLIRHAIYRTLELGGQFVLLGSSPVPKIQKEFEEISDHFKTHEHARLILKYDESLSHLIYAASDMLIIPSIFEPCGLTQMIAMRYGSIPIARKTGGLNDSVFDVDDDTIPVQFRNGFTFVNADEKELNSSLERAINHYVNNADSWKELVKKDMNIDFSWDSSASLYEELYWNSISRARATNRS